MRLSATKAILERPDCVIVATVSAIYGIGDPSEYHSMILHLKEGDALTQRDAIRRLTEMQYTRNEADFRRGTFRVRGDVIDIFPAEHAENAVRVSLFDDEIESLQLFDPLTGHIRQRIGRFTVFPSSHYVTGRQKVLDAIEKIKVELVQQKEFFVAQMKLIEAQRIEQRTRFDLEMMTEIGFCKGIENYSRHLSGRKAGEPPPTLIDYLPPRSLMFVDESHVTIPQVGGMYKGDRARKENLVNYGFRLPSALDNRPLRFDEFERLLPQTMFVSATPADYEQTHSGQVVEQLVRPTGLVDPTLEVRPAQTQVDDLLSEINLRVGKARARAGDDADEADGGGPHRLPQRARREGALSPFRHRHGRARRDHPRPAPRRVRRAGRDQPAARRARHSGGVAGGDPRRRQGRLPALRALADPDDRPRGAAHQRDGDPVRRRDDGFDEGGDRRDHAATRTSRSRGTRRWASRRSACRSGSRT